MTALRTFRPRLLWARRSAFTALFAAVAVFVSGGVAFAFWTIATTAGAQGSTKGSQLSAPTSPTRTANNDGTVTIGWTLPSGGQLTGAQYKVVRSTDNAVIGTVASTVTSVTDTSVPPGTNVQYSISAVLGTNWHSSSITTTAVTTPTPTFALTLSANSTTAGSSLTVTGLVAKNAGTTETTYTGTKTITWSGLVNSPSGQAPSYPGTSVTFDHGVAQLGGPYNSSVTAYKSGSSTLTATDAVVGATTGSANFTVNAGSASSISAQSGSGQSATTSTAFTNPLVALVTDAYGNPVSGVSVTFSAPASGASATFKASSGACNNSGTTAASCSTTTGSDGLATSSTVAANGTTGGYNVTATAGVGSATFSLTNVASPPTVVVTHPTANQSFANNGAFQNDCGSSSTGICGTVTAGSNGVSGVTLTLSRTVNGTTTYWSGSAWTSSPPATPLSATTTSGNWLYSISYGSLTGGMSHNDVGSYTATVTAADNSTPAVTGSASRTFSVTA